MTNDVSQFQTFDLPPFEEIEPDVFVPRHQLHPSVLRKEATTFGWDTIQAIRLPQVNQILRQYSPPPPFEYQFQENGSLAGEFDTWSLVRGGSGATILLKAPMKRCTMKFPNTDMDFENGWVIVQVKLKYLPKAPDGYVPDRATNTSGELAYLAVDLNSQNAGSPLVLVNQINTGSFVMTPTQKVLFRSVIQEYFNQNSQLFTYLFAAVRVNALANNRIFQWLKPTYTSYGYVNGATEETSIFGILSMTQNRSPEKLAHQVPLASIPHDNNSAFLISGSLFLEKLVLPGLSKVFLNASGSDFMLANNAALIEIKNPVKLNDIQLQDKSYTPYLVQFTFQILGNECQIYSKVRVNLTEGVKIFVESTRHFGLRLVQKADGSPTLDFLLLRQPKTRSWDDITGSLVTISRIFDLINNIKQILSGETIELFSKDIIATTIISAVAGLESADSSFIKAVADGKASEVLPSISGMISEATQGIQWGKSSKFELESVELNGALIFGGNA